MKRLEREAIDQMYEAIRFAGTLRPRNPADMAAIVKNASTSALLNKRVAAAIICLRFGDFEGVAAQMREARAVVKEYEDWERDRDS